MKIIAHIGHGKTGTTSIQKSLSLSQEQLRTAGSYYVGLNFELSPVQLFPWQTPGGWAELVQNGPMIAQSQLAEIVEKTIAALQNDGVQQIIWSNESVLARFDVVGPVLQKLRMNSHAVDILIYLRRHDSWARSAYLQWGIKHKTYSGKVLDFTEWLKNNPINFARPVNFWLEHQWDNVFVRNFDAHDDIVQDFLSCCSLPPGLIQSRRDNESPSTVALALWALFNSQRPEPTLPYELQPMLNRCGVINKNYHHLDLTHLFPNPENMSHLMEDVQQDFAAINNILIQHGQPPFDNKPLKQKFYNVSNEQIFSALLDIIQFQDQENSRQNDELRKLKRRLNQLEKKFSDSQ